MLLSALINTIIFTQLKRSIKIKRMKDSKDKKIISVNINGVFNMSMGTVVTFYTLNDDIIRVGDIICDNDVCHTVKGFVHPNDTQNTPNLFLQ